MIMAFYYGWNLQKLQQYKSLLVVTTTAPNTNLTDLYWLQWKAAQSHTQRKKNLECAMILLNPLQTIHSCNPRRPDPIDRCKPPIAEVLAGHSRSSSGASWDEVAQHVRASRDTLYSTTGCLVP
jgi:hypothetical protein